jgi:hypothetical protein
MICSSVNLLFFMPVNLHGDGLHKPYAGSVRRWQVTIGSFLKGLSSQSVLYIKILKACADVQTRASLGRETGFYVDSVDGGVHHE